MFTIRSELGTLLTFVRRHYLLLVGVCVLAVVAYGFSAFNLILAGDDWEVYLDPDRQETWVVRLGRWMQSLIWQLFAGNTFAPTFTLGVLVTGLILGGVIAAVTIGLTRTWANFLFIGLFVLSPLWVEQINFELNHLAIGIGVVLSCLAGFTTWRLCRAGAGNDSQTRRFVGSYVASAVRGMPTGITGHRGDGFSLRLSQRQSRRAGASFAATRGVTLVLLMVWVTAAIVLYGVLTALARLIVGASAPHRSLWAHHVTGQFLQ